MCFVFLTVSACQTSQNSACGSGRSDVKKGMAGCLTFKFKLLDGMGLGFSITTVIFGDLYTNR